MYLPIEQVSSVRSAIRIAREGAH